MMKTPANRSSALSTHRQRLEAVLAGKRPDRTPVALWRHFPVDDQDPFRLARATGAFANQYDFDLIKVTPGSSYSVHDWGTRDDWRGVISQLTRFAIQRIGRISGHWTPRQARLARNWNV